jgi:pimeloyl-ACP methyl ester carboxylesterase
VIIHGFSSLPAEKRLKLLIEKIKEEFTRAKIVCPDYLEKYQKPAIFTAGKRSIYEYATLCKEIIEKEKIKGPIFIIGYSLGGLIARVLVEMMEIDAQAIILVGTPNKGIKLNRWEKLILMMFKRPTIEEMLPNSQFLRKLNEDYAKLQLKTRYYLLASSEDKRVPIWSALGIEFIKSEGTFIGSTNHSGLIPKELKSPPTAIDIIIQILKREADFQSASFLSKRW